MDTDQPRKTMQRTRRNFLKQSGLLAGAMIAAPQIVRAETLGLNGATAANSRINLAILATGNRSRGATTPYFRDQRCAVTVLCDPYRERIDGFKQRRCQDFSGLETQDFREALADKEDRKSVV